MNIKIPPRYIPLPAEIAYSKESAALKDTFTKIFGLAWEMDYKHTPSLAVDDLINFLYIARRTYFLHVEKLCELSWLRSETPRIGFVRFSFPIVNYQAGDFSAKSCTKVQNVALKEEEEEDRSSINDSSSSSSSASAKICTTADGRFALLRAAGVYPIQIEKILGDETLTTEDILAEIARCYDPASGIRKPHSIIGIELSSGYRAEATYYGSVANIPSAILERAGLTNLIPVLEPDFSNTQNTNEFENFPIPYSEDPSIDQPIGKFTPRKAWQAVLDQLQMEIPRATFDSFLSNTWPARYDHTHNVLIVGTRSAYACEWLSGRLTSTVTRLLTGLFNQSVEVKFEEHQGDGKC
jgi:hypothetical protein